MVTASAGVSQRFLSTPDAMQKNIGQNLAVIPPSTLRPHGHAMGVHPWFTMRLSLTSTCVLFDTACRLDTTVMAPSALRRCQLLESKFGSERLRRVGRTFCLMLLLVLEPGQVTEAVEVKKYGFSDAPWHNASVCLSAQACAQRFNCSCMSS